MSDRETRKIETRARAIVQRERCSMRKAYFWAVEELKREQAAAAGRVAAAPVWDIIGKLSCSGHYEREGLTEPGIDEVNAIWNGEGANWTIDQWRELLLKGGEEVDRKAQELTANRPNP